jgi:hypothetical protein
VQNAATSSWPSQSTNYSSFYPHSTILEFNAYSPGFTNNGCTFNSVCNLAVTVIAQTNLVFTIGATTGQAAMPLIQGELDDACTLTTCDAYTSM